MNSRNQNKPNIWPDDWNDEADVVIVGAGGAGLTAAIESASRRADTVVFEKLGTVRASSTTISGGVFSFAGTDFQRKRQTADKGTTDSDRLLYEDIMKAGGWENDPKLVKVYINNQLDTYNWLTRHGVKWNSISTGAGMSVPRGHRTNPVRLVGLLEAEAERSGAKIMYRSPATGLVTDENGRVTGVCVARHGAGLRVRARKGVILATGGFGRAPDRLEAIAPGMSGVAIVVGTGHTGDGHKMAESLGAFFKDREYVKPTFGIHASSNSTVTLALIFYAGAIIVNKRGERFIDESAGYKDIGKAALGQPGGIGFQIFDRNIYAMVTAKDVRPAIRGEKIAALSVRAETIEELAPQIGISPEVLKQTVSNYNRYVDYGKDPDFGRTTKVGGIGSLVKIQSPPFYAYESKGMLVGTYAGIAVDENMRVMGSKGVIRGLFAAGELVGGFHGMGYMTGTALAKAIIFGRIAGQNAVKGDSVIA